MTTPFNDTPLAVGSFTGYRCFDIVEDGTLAGPSFPQAFLPGENVAKCLYRAQRFFPSAMFLAAISGTAADLSGAKSEHRAGTKNCTCGFYAYCEGANQLHMFGRVQALVEGYGQCVYGDLGFRAEKARLVALVQPTAARTLRQRFRWRWFPNGMWLVGTIIFAVWMVTDWVLGASTLSYVVDPILFSLYLFLFLAASFNLTANEDDGVKRSKWRKVQAKYPDVPVYRTLKEAIAAHPVTDLTAVSHG